MSTPGDSPRSSHSVKKFLLIRAGMLAGELNLDIYGATVADAMTSDVGFAVMPDIYGGAVLGVELPYRVIESDASVLAERHDNFVL